MHKARTISRTTAAAAVALAFVLAGCSDSGSVEEPAASFVPPADWTLDETETLNGFESIERRFVYSSAESRNQACASAARALADWAQVDVPDLNAEENLGCSYSTTFLERFPGENLTGSVVVYPMRVDGEVVGDRDHPGGTGQIWFNVTKPK